MLSVLLFMVFGVGHVGVSLLILTCACGLFRELVNVAHSEANAEKEVYVLLCYLDFSSLFFLP
jgi:hypothetical protein